MFLVNVNFPAYFLPGRILGDVNLNLDDKAAIKARGLWEDWHLRQLIDHPSRTNHVSGRFVQLVLPVALETRKQRLPSCGL